MLQASVLNFIKKRLQHRCFPVNIAKNKYFEEHLRTAASDCRLHLQLRGTFACWTGWNGVRYNYVLYLFVSFWYYYTFILSRSSRTEIFLKKVFLKIVQNSLENTCTGIFFFLMLLATLMKRLRHSVFQNRWLFALKAPS